MIDTLGSGTRANSLSKQTTCLGQDWSHAFIKKPILAIPFQNESITKGYERGEVSQP